MQNLSLDQIIANIEQGICFEASHEDSFFIKIQEYVPYVCTAIHAGSKLRKELQDTCMLSEEERYYEEDPHTEKFIQSLPLTLVGNDSRYEYDLNRDEENAIYDIAWGKQVWKRPLTDEERHRSILKHRNFYTVVHALLNKLEKEFGAAVVYDIHSYNYKRHPISYLFNIGIENIDVKKYNPQLSYWKKQLMSIRVKKLKTDVSVNHIFYGRGYLLKYVKDHFDHTLVLATEVKKVFMDEHSGEAYPLVIQSIAKGLKNAIINNSQHYINAKSNIDVKRKNTLLTSVLQPELIKLDRDLYKLAKNFEVLGFVNPQNVEQEKRKFFKSKFTRNPEFRYKPLTIDPHVFKSKMYQLDVDGLEDVHIRQVYIDIIRSYTDKVDLLNSLGQENFLYNSLRYFGEPSQQDIANATFLLYCDELPQFENEAYLDTKNVKQAFVAEGKKYGFDFNVQEVSHIPSDALVINSKKLLLLKKGAKFTQTRLNALLNHEIGVHMVTTMNAQDQPLRFLSLGLPRNTYTQEGLAIMSELLSGCLSIGRLKELALRVLAVQSLTQGNDFKSTFEMLRDTHQVSDEKLFYLTTRVYRGGGFTKDYLYLRGFRKVLDMRDRGVKLDNLFLGKTTHTHLTILNELVDRGILNKPKYQCHAFMHPLEMDPILKYLTNSLK
ncbi:MAG: flavohemoglobin expression-modulating QEGLA motif protein [Salibacteraceae bacterium]